MEGYQASGLRVVEKDDNWQSRLSCFERDDVKMDAGAQLRKKVNWVGPVQRRAFIAFSIYYHPQDAYRLKLGLLLLFCEHIPFFFLLPLGSRDRYLS